MFHFKIYLLNWLNSNWLCLSVRPSVCVSFQESDDGFSWQAFQSSHSSGHAGLVTSNASWCLHNPAHWSVYWSLSYWVNGPEDIFDSSFKWCCPLCGQSSALRTMNKSRCVMMQLCVCSASSCGVKLAHPAGNSKNYSDKLVLSLLLRSLFEFYYSLFPLCTAISSPCWLMTLSCCCSMRLLASWPSARGLQ